jgi:isopenicillin N synthase-like dioxygenase
VSTDIPLIDLRAWREGDPERRRAVAVELDGALQTCGFLMVDHHGVDAELGDALRAAARRFFALAPERKARYATAVGGRGWLAPGREANAFYGEVADGTRADLKESWTSGRDHRSGDPDIDAEWFAPNVWPEEVPELAELSTRFSDGVRVLYAELLEMAATALGLAPDWFTGRVRSSPHTFNLNRYPPLTETGRPGDGQFRIAPHTDWGILTVLDRQPGYGGLQVQGADGTWEDAPFAPGAFTINVGDLMARWTGDRWRSTRHRVLPPPPDAPDEELISLVVFLEADMDTVIRPLPAPIGHNTAYPPVTAGDYLRERTRAADVA